MIPQPQTFAPLSPLSPEDIRKTREYFPRGLFQPPGSFRFAMDSLLLASFLEPGPLSRVLDLGTGCGVVALALLCRYPHIRAVGLEKEPLLAAAAQKNARGLGFSGQFRTVCADLREASLFGAGAGLPEESAGALLENSFDLALANPPFRQPEKGRLPKDGMRRKALFEEPDTLRIFCRAASRALGRGGRFGILYDAGRLPRLLRELKSAGLAPVRLLAIQTRPGKAAQRILLEAVKTEPGLPMPEPAQERPLLLYAGKNGELRQEALAFCPFLASNGQRGRP